MNFGKLKCRCVLLAAVVLCLGCGKLATSKSAGVAKTLGSAGGAVTFENVTVTIPKDALTRDQEITIVKATEHPKGNIGPAYVITMEEETKDHPVGSGMETFTFAKPVSVTIQIGTAEVPAGVSHEDLRLAWTKSGSWHILKDSKVDSTAGTVSAKTDHLSTWAVVVKPECEADIDCPEGKTCQAGSCKAPPTCNIWEYVSDDDLAFVEQCNLMGEGDEEPVLPSFNLAGYLFDTPLIERHAFFVSALDEDGQQFTFELPCEGLTLEIASNVQFSGFEQGGHYPVLPTACQTDESCDCEICAFATVTMAGHEPLEAVGGRVELHCDPEDSDCNPFTYCLATLDLEFAGPEGQTWWLRLKHHWPDLLLKDEWIQTMTSGGSNSCPVHLGASLTFYDNTCYAQTVTCDGKGVANPCWGPDAGEVCGWWSLDPDEAFGMCDGFDITCEEPAAWDMQFVFDSRGAACEFCTNTDDKDICTPIDAQCGGSQEIAYVASGSAEDGPHPMVECPAEECAIGFDATATEAEVVAAYSICVSPMAGWDTHFNWRYGRLAAYLYSDGRLLYRTEDAYNQASAIPSFEEVVLADEQYCQLLADISINGLANEAIAEGLSLSAWTDLPSTEVFLDHDGQKLSISMYGDLFDEDTLVEDFLSIAPNAITLAQRLGALSVGGSPYLAQTAEVAACSQPDQSQLCQIEDATKWPFAEVDISGDALPCVHDENELVPVVLSDEMAKQVRGWWMAEVESQPCSRVLTTVDGMAFEVFLIDSPPGGQSAMPFQPCHPGT